MQPFAFPARDALDIERRWRKGVKLRNEARRYTVCCERLQGMARDLAVARAPLPVPTIWPTHDRAKEDEPSALAYLAVFEYLRRFYRPIRAGKDGQQRAVGLKDDRVEAIFHAPEKPFAEFLALLTHVMQEPKLPQIFEAAAQKAEVSSLNHRVSALECRLAFEQRYSVVASCIQEGYGLVDVFELV